jgi:hypothetical protein
MKAAYTTETVARYKRGSQLIIIQRPQSQAMSLFYHNPTKLKNAQPFSFVCMHNKLLKLHLTSAKVLAEFLLQPRLLGPIQTQHKFAVCETSYGIRG